MPEGYFRSLSTHLTHCACRWEDLHLTPGQDQILPHPVVVLYNSWRIQMRSIFGCVRKYTLCAAARKSTPQKCGDKYSGYSASDNVHIWRQETRQNPISGGKSAQPWHGGSFPTVLRYTLLGGQGFFLRDCLGFARDSAPDTDAPEPLVVVAHRKSRLCPLMQAAQMC